MTGPGGLLLVPVPGGSRFGRIAGHPPLSHCLRTMAAGFETVVVPIASQHGADAEAWVPDGVVLVEVAGGATRTECLRAGLEAAPLSTRVVVHDITRPLTPSDVCDRVLVALASGSEFVVPTLTVVDSVKSVDVDGSVTATVDRATLRSTQFPRGMTTSFLRRALAADEDELAYALRSGVVVSMVDGDPKGFEIVTPRDTALADAIMANP